LNFVGAVGAKANVLQSVGWFFCHISVGHFLYDRIF
jgi:hypothetical protein